MPKVAVVMAAKNAEIYIADAVRSVLGQEFADLELIVAEDGSTDGTYGILRGLDDRRLTIVRTAGVGPAAARNRAAARSTAPYIAVIDADDIALEGRFALQSRFLDEHPEYGLVGSSAVIVDDAGGVLGKRAAITGHDTLFGEMLQRNCFVHSSVMFRRTVFERLGGYRESLWTSEDYDLILRFSEVTKIENLAEYLCMYRENPSGLTYSRMRVMDRTSRAVRALAVDRRDGRDEDPSVLERAVSGTVRGNGSREEEASGWRNRVKLSRTFYAVGCAQFCRGDRGQAAQAFRKALRVCPANVKAIAGLGLAGLPRPIGRVCRPLFRRTLRFQVGKT